MRLIGDLLYHFRWLRVSWMSVSLWPKKPERRCKQTGVTEQAGFWSELCAVRSMSLLGDKGIFFFTSTWILKVALPLQVFVLAGHLFNPGIQLMAFTFFPVQLCCSWSLKLQEGSTGFVTIPSTVKTWRDYFSNQLLPFLHFEAALCFCVLCNFSQSLARILHRTYIISGVDDFNCMLARV